MDRDPGSVSDYCRECLGEGETFPNEAQDWIRCPVCKGTKVQPPPIVIKPGCECHTCVAEACRVEPAPPDKMMCGIDLRLSRYFLCETCGNKRCPHATNHVHPCSGSNDPGQPGSSYA